MRIPNMRPGAIAHIRGEGGISGAVKFYQMRDGVVLTADIAGLPQTPPSGFFAMHIHEGPDCGGTDYANTGGHFNPSGAAHPAHAGDLPPLLSGGGQAHMAVWTNRFRLADVIGKTVVIHENPDDFHTQPAGNSGRKLACGVIMAVR